MFYAPRREDSGRANGAKGLLQTVAVLFLETSEVALPLPTSRAALVLCRAHGLLIDVSSRAARDTD